MSAPGNVARATSRVESAVPLGCEGSAQVATTVSSSSSAFQTTHPLGRVARLRDRLGERDRQILEILSRLRLLTGAQVQRLQVYDGSEVTRARRTRAILKRLTDLKLVVRLGRRVGGIQAGSDGYLYGLSGLGQAVVAADSGTPRTRRTVWETSPSHSDHLLAISDLYVSAIEAERREDLELLEFQAEPMAWRRFPGLGGQSNVLKPDAYVRLGIGDVELSAFLEVDLATESSTTITRKCAAYTSYWNCGLEQHQHGVFPRVLWLTPTAARVVRLGQVLRRLPAHSRPLFAVALLDDWLAALAMGGGDAS